MTRRLNVKKDMKIELKNIALSTSKMNYIDQIITYVWILKHNLPIDKIFSKTLQEKFAWVTK